MLRWQVAIVVDIRPAIDPGHMFIPWTEIAHPAPPCMGWHIPFQLYPDNMFIQFHTLQVQIAYEYDAANESPVHPGCLLSVDIAAV